MSQTWLEVILIRYSRTWFIPILLLGTVLASSSTAHAQQSITVETLSREAHGPIRRATLELTGPLLAKPITREAGTHGPTVFYRLSPGQYTLTASAPGYYPQSTTVFLKPRETQRLTFELTRLGVIREEITIHPSPDLVDGTQMSSEAVLGQRALDTLPMARRTNLPDVVAALVPSAVPSHDNFVHLRGNELSLNNFINGVSFFDNPHQFFTPGLSPDVIQSVNVITGGFPAEYGNRFGGILDIVTKSGFDLNHHGSIALGGGTDLRHNVSLEYGGRAARWGYYFYTSGFESNRFLNPPQQESLHDQGKGLRNFVQLDYELDDRDFLRLVLTGDGTNFQIPNTVEEEGRGRTFSQKNREQTAILSWDHTFSDALLRTSAYERLAQAELSPTTDPISIQARSLRTVITLGIKSDYSRTIGRRHLLRLGLDATSFRLREDFRFDPRENEIELLMFSFRGRKTGGQVSFYVQDQFTPIRNLTANVGLRTDQYSLVTSAFQVSPRVNLAYSLPGSHSVIHFAYNRLFAPPPIENLLLGSSLAADSRAVRPMISNLYEVGVSQSLKRRLLIEVNTYIRKDRNTFETTELANVRHFLPTNFAHGEAYGAEISVQLREIKRLGLSGYFSYTAARSFFFGPISGGFSDEDLEPRQRVLPAFDQLHSGTAGVTWRHHPSRFWASFTLEYGSGTPTEGEVAAPVFERLPGHLVANFYTGLDLFENEGHHLDLQFSLENITNRIFAIAKESEFTPQQFSPPRFFSASLRVEF